MLRAFLHSRNSHYSPAKFGPCKLSLAKDLSLLLWVVVMSLLLPRYVRAQHEAEVIHWWVSGGREPHSSK